MIITRSPLRITLGGGGTDLPSYYREHGGFLIAAAIDKYVYITVMRPFTPGHLPEVLAARARRAASTTSSIRSSARRSRMLDFTTPQLEITTLADIPAGTGLGSSGSFTTALLKALYAHRRRLLHPRELAEQACDIEIDRLGEPIGKQDQYIAAYGGITCFTFHPDGRVEAEPLPMSDRDAASTSRTTCCCSSPASRAAPAASSRIRRRGPRRTITAMLEQPALRQGARLAQPRDALEAGDTAAFGALMHEHWEHKKRAAPAG